MRKSNTDFWLPQIVTFALLGFEIFFAFQGMITEVFICFVGVCIIITRSSE
tara:strand:- start:478 stop:630 length:153 start_codon:yes stop_codon:yes gene_type:complete